MTHVYREGVVKLTESDESGVSEQQLLVLCELLEIPEVAGLMHSIAQEGATEQRVREWQERAQVHTETLDRLLLDLCEPLAEVVVTVWPEEVSFWFYPTARIRRRLRAVDLTCTANSPMGTWLAQNPSMVAQLRIENAISASRRDGVEIDFESAKHLIALRREPRTRSEMVVSNAFKLFEQSGQYAQTRWTVEMFLHIFEQLTKGFGTSISGSWLDQPLASSRPVEHYPFATPRDVIDSLCAMANGDGPESGAMMGTNVSPVLTATLLERTVSLSKPFPMLNDLMARIIWHCYFERTEYPVLSVVPYSTALLNSVQFRYGARSLSPAPGRGNGDWFASPDITNTVDWELELVEQAVRDLELRIETTQRQEQHLVALLKVDPELNPRQRSIIGRALSNPTATFVVSYHQTWHDIAYSTARIDFIELEEKGYLVRLRQGRAHVYCAAPDLVEKLGEDTVNALRRTWDE